jgi:hypothetical protein
MRELADRMEGVALSMSTRFIGTFPTNMRDIVELTNNAVSTLDILVDGSNYGGYSEPEQFRLYLNGLLGKRRNLTVRMLVYNRDLSKKSSLLQFPLADFEKLPNKDNRYKEFFEDYNPGIEKPKNGDNFINLLLQRQSDYVRELAIAGVNIKTVAEPSMMFLWLKDNEEAVFSFLHTDVSVEEIAFRTRDGHLINTFFRHFNNAWNHATRLPLNGSLESTAADQGAQSRAANNISPPGGNENILIAGTQKTGVP